MISLVPCPRCGAYVEVLALALHLAIRPRDHGQLCTLVTIIPFQDDDQIDS